MSIFSKLFGSKNKKPKPDQTDIKKPLPSIEGFPKLSASERMSVIMVVGDTGKAEYFPLIKYAILNDPDMHVKFAALKRIHLFKDHEEVVPMLTEMKKNDAGNGYEPYFSMALSRVGIITLKQFEEVIKNAK